MIITGIDSGEKTGWAQAHEDGLITACGLVLVHPNRPLGAIPESFGGLVVIEKPIIRTKGARPADPNAMVTLGIKVGRYKETYLVLGNDVVEIWPHDWKGGVPKDIQNQRDRDSLTRSERETVDWAMRTIPDSYQNNVWDGIGITKWAVRNLAKVRRTIKR